MQQVSNIRESARSQLRPKKKLRTKRRSREDVQIDYVNPSGKLVTAENVPDFLRSMMFEETRSFKELAETTAMSGGVKSPATISRLFYGESRQPKLSTQVSVMRLYGYAMKIVKARN